MLNEEQFEQTVVHHSTTAVGLLPHVVYASQSPIIRTNCMRMPFSFGCVANKSLHQEGVTSGDERASGSKSGKLPRVYMNNMEYCCRSADQDTGISSKIEYWSIPECSWAFMNDSVAFQRALVAIIEPCT